LLIQQPSQEFASGESVHTQFLRIPQARHTFALLAFQPDGWWGFSHGVNEHGVAAAVVNLRSLLQSANPGLTGGDLVRIALARSQTARQAVECLTGLVERHGQSPSPGASDTSGSDHGFLVADSTEAFAVETADRFWVFQEINEVRAMGNASVIHQDWNRIAGGLAGNAIERGWWPGDGTKLDYASAVSHDPTGQASGLRRWGRATSLLEQQNGHIDLNFFRRVLADHYEGTHCEVEPFRAVPGPVPLCQHGHGSITHFTHTSFIVQLNAAPAQLPIAWWAFGPPCIHVYFPLFFEGEIPSAFSGPRSAEAGDFAARLLRLHDAAQTTRGVAEHVRESFGLLQARFDREAAEFAMEAAGMKLDGDTKKLAYLASSFMLHIVERFETILEELENTYLTPATSSRGVLLSDR
jgi:secernin